MANPQPENGHIDLANELVEALMRISLNGTQYRLLWVVWRKTYGWHRKEDTIAESQFEALTGLDKRVISRGLQRLRSRRILVIKGDSFHPKRYAFQSDYERWLPPLSTNHRTVERETDIPLSTNHRTVEPNPDTQVSTNPMTEENTELSTNPMTDLSTNPMTDLSTNSPPTKERKKRKKVKKTSSSSLRTSESLGDYRERLRGEFPDLDIDEEWRCFEAYWSDDRRTLTHPKLNLRNWMKKARKIKQEAKEKGAGSSGLPEARRSYQEL